MATEMINLFLSLAIQFYACEGQEVLDQSNPSSKTIEKREAIAIANKRALRTYKTLDKFTVVPCEQTEFWRIIFDGGGPEYVIDKRTGKVIRTQKIPQGQHDIRPKLRPAPTNTSISKQQAIEIAKKDARSKYGKEEDIDDYAIIACEQAKSWRLIFDFKPALESRVFPNGSTPKYVIDKASGAIIYRERN